MKHIICSIGHTAAGKTTTLKTLSDKMQIPLISEGAIKRTLAGGRPGYMQLLGREREDGKRGVKRAPPEPP